MIKEDYDVRKKVSKYRIRQFVKPGLTGWAAINGYRGGTKDLELMKKRVEHDISYIENWSFLFDLKIILRTVWQMITFRIPNAY
jgi:lipopolysaccharide/colanic/teichoic acid biosynthesis glycosyltransferase